MVHVSQWNIFETIFGWKTVTLGNNRHASYNHVIAISTWFEAGWRSWSTNQLKTFFHHTAQNRKTVNQGQLIPIIKTWPRSQFFPFCFFFRTFSSLWLIWCSPFLWLSAFLWHCQNFWSKTMLGMLGKNSMKRNMNLMTRNIYVTPFGMRTSSTLPNTILKGTASSDLKWIT